MCLSIATHITITLPFVPDVILVVLGVPIFKHIREQVKVIETIVNVSTINIIIITSVCIRKIKQVNL